MTSRLKRWVGARDPIVLAVDDQEPNIRLLGTILSQTGFDVVPALNGEQALQRLEAAQPDLVLLDLVMPGMDGLEVMRRIRETHPELPVIMLTAHADRAHLVRAFEAGVVDYVAKPFVADELLARVRLHIELKLVRDHLKRVAAEREKLASMVAHDLKNPLSSVRFSAQLLSRPGQSPDRIAQLGSLIERSADRALGFIQRYLERRAEGELLRQLQPGEVELQPLLDDLLERFQPQAQAKDIEIQMQWLREGLLALADADALTHVLENLLSNALKYSPAQSTVLIEAGDGPGRRVRIAVKDQGPGIQAEERQRLFSRFARLQNRPTQDESSSGLGLSLAKEDALQMGGDLWYEDRPGGGSVFVIDLPAASGAE